MRAVESFPLFVHVLIMWRIPWADDSFMLREVTNVSLHLLQMETTLIDLWNVICISIQNAACLRPKKLHVPYCVVVIRNFGP